MTARPVPTDQELHALGWSPRHLHALSALFGTIARPSYEGESERHARLAAAALSEVAEPSDLRQLRLLLVLLEAPIGTPTTTGTRAFSSLSQAQREHLLHAWSTSRLPQRRTFFQTIKRLAAFFAYADPGPSGTNPRWESMGYEIPKHQIPDPGPIARALIEPPRSGEPLQLDAEVVIVGSGAGGGVVAARLAMLGHDVLVLEAGPYVPEAELPTNELDAFDRLYLDHGLTATRDLGVSILAGSALGGGTLINWTTCIEPLPHIRQEWASLHGLEGFDGASTDDDLAQLRDELGFCPPPSIGPKDRALLDGAQELGWSAAPTERNADGCGDCGACGFGCRRGTKRSGQRLHLAAAASAGARLLPNARVTRVRDGRVTGTLASRRQLSVTARAIVVAAGALRTPLILARSGIEHPHLGANLHLHPTAIVAGRFANDVAMWRGTMQAAHSTEFIQQGVLIESAPGHPGLIGQAFPWAGSSAFGELMREVRRYAPLIGILRDTGSGRVTLTGSGRARIDYRLDRRDVVTARLAVVQMARLARAAGAERIVALGTPAEWHDVSTHQDGWDAYLDRLRRFDFRTNRGTLFSAHQMGTVSAGSDPKTHPCDPWGRVRGTKNVYVADASLFPTALGVNPMVTVMALAARVATAIHSDQRS